MENTELCIFGDSISKGVVYDEARGRYVVCRDNCLRLLAQERQGAVNNYARMGQTTQDALERMTVSQLKPGAIAVLEFGGNDCDLDWNAVSEHPEREQFGRVPIKRFEKNLRALIQRTVRAGMKPLLVTPPPLIAARYFEWVSRGLDRLRILKYLGDVEHIYRWQERYARTVTRVAREEGVPLFDARDHFLSLARLDQHMCVDGIHPNEKGHGVLLEAIRAFSMV